MNITILYSNEAGEQVGEPKSLAASMNTVAAVPRGSVQPEYLSSCRRCAMLNGRPSNLLADVEDNAWESRIGRHGDFHMVCP